MYVRMQFIFFFLLKKKKGSENVTTLYDVLESKRTLISILELAKADVYHFFVGREASRHGWSLEKPAVREAFARMVVTNAVQGLKQMHDKGYLHCDLKSLNVLLYIYKHHNAKKQGGVFMKAKLTDFGHSSKGIHRTAEATFGNGFLFVCFFFALSFLPQ
ncbi:Kkq8p [Reticulomyxa filosa]|uniref:Kkq8p n=1 Tax=Reticulomyxa filosa TaxID=46433 RepID=X6MCA1_RETFI|nr:Kkq8p [Reticulomyxa filosa]|eukprot:ETO11291.1 Kkq8p [Reticulomyxa filosa]